MLFTVVLDACVLFPASLRDTLLRAANADLYNVRLTNEILEEMRRNLVEKGMSEDKSQRLIATIKREFAEAFVTHHTSLIDAMPNDPKDRHVLAAAVACRAQVIVTLNLRHFSRAILAPFEVEAQSPDDFLTHLFYLNPQRVIEVIERQARGLRNPSMTVSDVLNALALHAPNFANLIEYYRYRR